MKTVRRLMATTQKARATRKKKSQEFGLLAYGSSGPWKIAIDEAVSGVDRWRAQIEGPSVSIYFAIPSLEVVEKASRFLASHATAPKRASNGASRGSGSLVIGIDKQTPVRLLGDDEYHDRVFLVAGPLEGPMIRFAFSGAVLAGLAEALQQVRAELEELN